MNFEPVLVLFAKKPIAGDVKTRLSPPLSVEQAQQVAQILIDQSLENATAYWPGEIEISVWPDLEDGFVQKMALQYQCKLSTQSQGNLGDKMYAAMQTKQANKQIALIMGCDVPHCPGEILRDTYQDLKSGRSIIGPTIDGGYYCIGSHKLNAKMFAGVNWGTEQTYTQTIAACKNCNIDFDLLLPELRDLDCYDDLSVLSEYCSALKPYLIN